MSAEEFTNTLGLLLLAGLIIASFIKMISREARLYDSSDKSVVWLHEVVSVSLLQPSSKFSLKIIRQSGNEQQPERIYSSNDDSLIAPSVVIEESLKTLRRAQIEGVHIVKNTSGYFEFSRMWHDHRGVKEGRKVERVIISAL